MNEVEIVNREITSEELNQVFRGFDEHSLDNGVEVQNSERIDYVALLKNEFIGCASGLAYKNGLSYSGWFYLTDLFVEKPYRSRGIGANLLLTLENEIKKIGVKNIWTWTAGYEAPKFYKKQGYYIFTEMEDWYSDGSSQVGFRKAL